MQKDKKKLKQKLSTGFMADGAYWFTSLSIVVGQMSCKII